MESIEPIVEFRAKTGPGRFQWNRGGWFGAQLGATAWMLLLGVLMLGQGRMGGAVVLALGFAVNGFGLWLWRGRQEREPYPAIQILLAACTVAAVAAVLIASAGVADDDGLAPSLPTLLVYPALMGIFHLQEQSARSASAEPPRSTSDDAD